MSDREKNWQSRLTQQQDELAVDFVESISVDRRLYKYDISGSIAHARMLGEQGIIAQQDFEQINQALTEIAAEIEQGLFVFDKTYEDIHMVIEQALIKRIGDVARKLHTGRSRNDQVALDMRLWLRDNIALMQDLLADLQNAFVSLADSDQGQIIMPGFTHLQRAQPVLVGHYLLVWVEQLERDRGRFADCLGRSDVCPLGSGALAGSSLPLNRERVAELLGFARVSRNSIDSISDRDFVAEYLFAAAMTAMHLSRLAEDWIIYSTQEFSFIHIDDAYCTGSSMMPQKRNPDMLELIRGKCGSIYGNLMGFLSILKAQPLAYNRDMQEDKKQLFDAADTLESCLKMTARIVRHTAFIPENIGRNLDRGFLDATALAEYLVNKGIPFRQGHQIVGRLVSRCEQQGITLSQLGFEQFREACDKIDKDVYDFLTPANVIKKYVTDGSSGFRQLQTQVQYWSERLSLSRA